MERKILLGLTTTPGSDWRDKIREINELNLKEIALFPTFLEIEERKELYKLLEKTNLKKIIHVHLREQDTEEWELDYCSQHYHCSLFNIHSDKETKKLLENTKYKDRIFVENLVNIDSFFIEIINQCAGICLDVSHCEDSRLRGEKESYRKIKELLEKYKIGCSHISAIKDKAREDVDCVTGDKTLYWSRHWLDDMKELDYVKKYVGYLPEYISIELENPFKKQLEVKAYLEKIINQKSNG